MPETIKQILRSSIPIEAKMEKLKDKSVDIPQWDGPKGLRNEYDATLHPVMNRRKYPDVLGDDGIIPVTRITIDLQRLATKRMTELVCGVPVKRVYKPENDRQKAVSEFIERIYQRNRIDSVNVERCNMLFAGCEVLTLWYATEESNTLYGETSPIKMRCRNFSPMNGDDIYPLWDDTGDLVAISVGYQKKNGKKHVNYFDTYTDDTHYRWSDESGQWAEDETEAISLGKIPAVYVYRPTPIWEDTSKTIYEMEWALSRNGNYLRENSKPILTVTASADISYGTEKRPEKEFRSILQFPAGSSVQYVTWTQAIENLKYYIDSLRSLFFTQLQLPDWNYEKMSQVALSGESRKQMFIDCQLKVKDESGRLLEFFDREMNVVKAFAKAAMGDSYSADIDALRVETQITPFTITDESDTIRNLITANGGEPIISQRESIEQLGWSEDVDRTLKEIRMQNLADAMEASV